MELGRSVRLREGPDLALIAYGAMVEPALDAAARLAESGTEATVINARFAKPLDERAILEAVNDHPLVVTLEDHALLGGFGSAVGECVLDAGARGARMVRIGLPDRFIEHGNRAEILARYRLDARQIADRCAAELQQVAH
ncbi:MAG: transketolase C-terminal domain-containing protein [Planctomycetota bacterium]